MMHALDVIKKTLVWYSYLFFLILFLSLERFEGFFPASITFNVGISDQMSDGIVHEHFVHCDKGCSLHTFGDCMLEFINFAHGHDASLVDNGNTVTQRFRLVHIMGGDQYGRIMHFTQFSDKSLNIDLRARIKTCRRLIE